MAGSHTFSSPRVFAWLIVGLWVLSSVASYQDPNFETPAPLNEIMLLVATYLFGHAAIAQKAKQGKSEAPKESNNREGTDGDGETPVTEEDT